MGRPIRSAGLHQPSLRGDPKLKHWATSLIDLSALMAWLKQAAGKSVFWAEMEKDPGLKPL
jgi:hypothetical protein